MTVYVVIRPVTRIESAGVQNPPKVGLLDPKSGLFEPPPPQPSHKTPFLAHFMTKSGLPDLGGCVAPPHPLATGLVVILFKCHWYKNRSSSEEVLGNFLRTKYKELGRCLS